MSRATAVRIVSATQARWFAPGRSRTGVHVLERRGARLGLVREVCDVACGDEELERRWRTDRPLILRGLLAPKLAKHRAAALRSVAFFDRVRAGATLQDEVWKRLAGSREFEPAGASVDLGDTREIEKVFAHRRAVPGATGASGTSAKRGQPAKKSRRIALDLYGKLCWISVDERDVSLRVRFSFGSETLMEWFDDPTRAVHADAFAKAVFPECAVLDENRELLELVTRLTGREIRLSERIVYNNAPGGGAIFHHDAEPWQLGVVYGQLVGETAWFALPKRELAELVPAFAKTPRAKKSFGTPARALRALDREDADDLARVLNETPALARVLVERGHFFRLTAGDAILMPSHGLDDVCWHAVIALGKTPSLAHSYGIFSARRRPDDPLAPKPTAGRASSPGGETRLST
ncbi:MAG: hypothetical protein IT453_11495 [Planctomycetes bacterium]|nr:hypothetical protein [Planctomycetota bacterium]